MCILFGVSYGDLVLWIAKVTSGIRWWYVCSWVWGIWNVRWSWWDMWMGAWSSVTKMVVMGCDLWKIGKICVSWYGGIRNMWHGHGMCATLWGRLGCHIVIRRVTHVEFVRIFYVWKEKRKKKKKEKKNIGTSCVCIFLWNMCCMIKRWPLYKMWSNVWGECDVT